MLRGAGHWSDPAPLNIGTASGVPGGGCGQPPVPLWNPELLQEKSEERPAALTQEAGGPEKGLW